MTQFKMYIQSLNGVPVDDWGFAAYLGAKNRNLPVVLYQDIDEVPVSKFNIVVSTVEDTITYFKKLGIEVPKAPNIPYSMRPFLGKRWIEYTTLGFLRQEKDKYTYPLFVKPKHHKKFPTMIFNSSRELDMKPWSDLSDDTEIMISSYMKFHSEWRVFVCEGKILGIKNYSGDECMAPSRDEINLMIHTYEDEFLVKDATKGYTLDVGVNNKGETVLVEINDGWAIGNYGLEGDPYVKLILARWREILNI